MKEKNISATTNLHEESSSSITSPINPLSDKTITVDLKEEATLPQGSNAIVIELLSLLEEWEKLPAEKSDDIQIKVAAHMPVFLPKKWDSTSKEHALIAFDPKTGTKFIKKSEKFTKAASIEFISLTKGQVEMPGTTMPAGVRYQRFQEDSFADRLVQDSNDNILSPCIAHGDYVKVESLQADHMHPKDNIRKRQLALVDKLNSDEEFAKFLLSQEGMDKFFVKVEEIFSENSEMKNGYYGTLFFYELYFNDIDNIWLICQACNLHKSNDEVIKWLKEQWLYGQEFINYLCKIASKENADSAEKNVLSQLSNAQNLAKVAIQWFWERHAHYMLTTKRLIQEVNTPIQILNKKLDSLGAIQSGRYQRKLDRLDATLGFLGSVATGKGWGIPPSPNASPHSSSDEDDFLRDKEGNLLRMSREQYKESADYVKGMLPKLIVDSMRKRACEKIEKESIASIVEPTFLRENPHSDIPSSVDVASTTKDEIEDASSLAILQENYKSDTEMEDSNGHNTNLPALGK